MRVRFEALESLRSRIDLIVMFRPRESGKLTNVLFEPECLVRKKHPPIFEFDRLGGKTRLLIAAGDRFVCFGTVHSFRSDFLDERRSRSLILDHDFERLEFSEELHGTPLQFRVSQTFAEDV